MTPNQRGIVLMVLGMAGFAIEDALIKVMAQELPVGQINLGLGCGGALVFGTLARRRGLSLADPAFLHPAVVGRNLCEMVGTFAFVLSLSLVPLSTVTSLFMATPLVVTLGAALFLRESVGWRRWAAVLAGFAGVLIVLRPGTEAFAPASALALLAVLGLGGRDLCSRRVPAEVPSVLVVAWGFGAVALVGLGHLLVTGGAVDPSPTVLLAYAAAVAMGCAAYLTLTVAMRAGEVSVIAPFRYSRLVFGLAIGIAVFGERPDGWTFAGAAVIAASGVYAALRERSRARAEAAAREALSGAAPAR